MINCKNFLSILIIFFFFILLILVFNNNNCEKLKKEKLYNKKEKLQSNDLNPPPKFESGGGYLNNPLEINSRFYKLPLSVNYFTFGTIEAGKIEDNKTYYKIKSLITSFKNNQVYLAYNNKNNLLGTVDSCINNDCLWEIKAVGKEGSYPYYYIIPYSDPLKNLMLTLNFSIIVKSFSSNENNRYREWYIDNPLPTIISNEPSLTNEPVITTLSSISSSINSSITPITTKGIFPENTPLISINNLPIYTPENLISKFTNTNTECEWCDVNGKNCVKNCVNTIKERLVNFLPLGLYKILDTNKVYSGYKLSYGIYERNVLSLDKIIRDIIKTSKRLPKYLFINSYGEGSKSDVNIYIQYYDDLLNINENFSKIESSLEVNNELINNIPKNILLDKLPNQLVGINNSSIISILSKFKNINLDDLKKIVYVYELF